MFFAKAERFLQSFALRLNVWYVALLGASLVALGLGSRVILKTSIESADRELIQAKLNEYLALYYAGGLEALSNRLDREDSRPFAVRVSDRWAETLMLHKPEPDLSFDLDSVRIVERHGDGLWLSLRSATGEPWRMGAVSLPGGRRLEVLMSRARSEAVVAAYDRRLTVLLAVALALGMIGGVILTRKTRRPIRDLIDTTKEILSSGRMEARVPIRGTGDELDELGQLYNRMLGENRRLIEGTRNALDDVAHDLRTPLTRLRMSAELGLAGNSDPKEALGDCLEESERVLTALNALMDLSEAETGAMRLDPIPLDLARVAEDVVDLYQYVAEDRALTLETSQLEAAPAEADETRIHQAVANLVDNAVKYTAPGGKVTLRTGRDDGISFLEVEDTGAGIPQLEQGRIFQRLYRTDRSRSKRGLGLGLSFVKAITDAHRGRVRLESEEGSGSRFRIELPVRAAAPGSSGAAG